MADAAEEVAAITAKADALVLNLGTINKAKIQAMLLAAEAAQTKAIPVVLDPVGVMSSQLRLEFALKLLTAGLVTIVRGQLQRVLGSLGAKSRGQGCRRRRQCN